MIVGPDGIGKSLVALSIAARVTNGQVWPDKATNHIERESGVLYLTEADAPEDTIRLRLHKMRAVLDRVFILQEIEKAGPIDGERTPFSIEGTIEMLTEIIESIDDCRLLVIDPLSNYLNPKPHEQKLMIASLVELAQRLQVGVLLVNRTPHFGEAARAVWTIVRDRRDRACRYLVPVKNSLAPDSRAMKFRIAGKDSYEAPCLEWEDTPVEMSQVPVLAKSDVPSLNSYELRREAVVLWLKDQLEAGGRLAQDIISAAKLERIAERSLRRALSELGGLSRKGPTGSYVWVLPNANEDLGLPQVCTFQRGANQAKLANLANLKPPYQETG